MTTPNERNCNYCGKLYSLLYTDRNGYSYNLNTSCCSKSCAAKASAAKGKGAVMPDPGPEALRKQTINFLTEQGQYCTKEEICKGVRHSSKLFAKHGLKISELNSEAGFTRPKSKFQENVGNILRKEFDNIETERKFEGLLGVTGHPLRVDFYLPDCNTVVEADGSQHSDLKHPWQKHKNGTVAEYDEIKNKFFEKHGIKIVRIPYKRNLKETEVLSRLK